MAKDHVDYYYVRWYAYATLAGERIDIAGFDITYELDGIPQATIYPTIGTEPVSGKEAGAVSALLAAYPYTPLQIYIKGETDLDSPQGQQSPGFPFNEFIKVFDGYYQGVGYRSSRSPAGGSVQVTGSAAHWLTALTGTSSKDTANTVKGPGGFAEVANLGQGPGLFDIQAAIAGQEGFAATTELWTEFIKQMFYVIADTKSVWGESDNTSALSALDRMDDQKVFVDNASNQLKINLLAGINVPPDMLTRFFGDSVAQPLFERWQEANLWTALLDAAGKFGFRIVPLIDTATCAPVFGALGGEPFTYITTAEYDDCFIVAATPTMVTKVVLVGRVAGSVVSVFSGKPVTSAVMGIASAEEAWKNPENNIGGVTLSIDAPSWIEGEVSVGPLTRQSLGGPRGIIPDAVNPAINAIAPDYDYADKYNNYLTSTLGDKVAQTILYNEMLKYRSGRVSGRFRLDICPGSTVGLQVIDDKFSKFNESPQYMFGLVHGVRLTMQAGGAGSSGTAKTSFELRFMRTGTEHTGHGSYFTAPEHPIYETHFLGTKLWTPS